MRDKFFLIVGLGLMGCSKDKKMTDTKADSLGSKGTYSVLTLDEYETFYNSDSNAVKTRGMIDLTIDFDCAVLVYPTDEEIDAMKKEYGEENFYIVADDNNWYRAKAIEMLDSVGIKKTVVHGDSLRFRGVNNKWGFDMKRDSLSGWNLILFSKTKGPMVVSMIDLTVSQIRDYFDLKE